MLAVLVGYGYNAAAAPEGFWSTEFSGQGLDNPARAMAVYDGELVVGGTFEFAGAQFVNGIASWDGESWHPLGTGLWDSFGVSVSALEAYDDCLYVGGYFEEAGGVSVRNLAKWYAGQWLPTAECNAEVSCMTVRNGDLIVGGGFDHVKWQGDWIYTGQIAGWNRSNWYPIAGPGGSNFVSDMVLYDGYLVACGDFQNLGGNYNLDYLARWDGESWSSFSPSGDDGVDWFVRAVEVFRGKLFIAGSFSTVGGRSIERLACWNGFEWSAVGTEVWPSIILGGSLNDLEVHNGALFFGGGIQIGPPWNTRGLMRWDGQTWTACDGGVDNSVYALASLDIGSGPKLYAGGAFTHADYIIDSRRIAAWEETPITTTPDLASPSGLALSPCSPNPFNSQTRLSFALAEAAPIRLDVLDILGRRLATPAEGIYEAGPHALDWTATDDQGSPLPSGLYLLCLSTPEAIRVQKIVLAK